MFSYVPMIAVAFFILAMVAFAAWAYLETCSRQTPLPVSDVIYDDADLRNPHRLLVSERYRLTGRPDYLIKTDEELCP